jgi:hypothetical protein
MWTQEMEPVAREWLPKFRGRPGLAAWSLTEEIGPPVTEWLTPFYALVRELDPDHPPVLLHNNLAAAQADAARNRPAAITYDFYPYFLDPRSGPTTPPRSRAMYLGRMEGFYRAARAGGGVFWAMPQAWAEEPYESFFPPIVGMCGGMREPTPAEMKWQAWAAVATGATGVMYFLYQTGGTGRGLRGPDWEKTPMWDGAAAAFAALERLEKVLVRLERSDEEAILCRSTNDAVLLHTFKKRPPYAGHERYAIVVNHDAENPQTFGIDLLAAEKPRVFDLRRGEEVTDTLSALTLEPGEGTVYLLGTEEEWVAVRQLLAP